MFCPNRKCPDFKRSGIPGQYEPGITTCPKCEHTLVDSKPEWAEVDDTQRGAVVPEYEDLVPACALLNASTIPLVTSLLQSANIRFFIKNESLQHLFGGGTLGVGHNPISGPPIVLVEPGRVGEARELLRNVSSSQVDA